MAFHGTQSRAALTSDQWDHCRDRVIASLAAAGERDLGDVSAYTGASGAGVLDVVIAECGYRPEQLSPADCDIFYEQVYESCREDGFEAMSVSATSWVMIYDPNRPLIARLRLICAEPIPVSRQSFGRLICSERRERSRNRTGGS
jgi:hypothetical protein